MTGYASATAGPGTATESGTITEGQTPRPGVTGSTSVTIELRSVNNRFLDLSFRMPDEFRSLEPAIRELMTAKLRRGKVELRMNTRSESEQAWPQPQAEQMSRLSRLESS